MVEAAAGGSVATRVARDVVVGPELEARGVQEVGQIPEPSREARWAPDELAGNCAVKRAGIYVDRVEP